MIYLELNGRTGNQLFRYAFARKLQMLLDEEITVRFHKTEEEDESFFYALKDYQVAAFKIEDGEELFSMHSHFLQKVVRRCYRIVRKGERESLAHFWHRQERWQSILNRFGIYKLIRGYAKPVKTIFPNIFLDSGFEDKRYFDDIRETLLVEFQPRMPRKEENKELYEVIDHTQSVCVSVRRGDYTNEKYRDYRDVCDLQYYRRAIEIIREKVKNPVFIFFSDDMEWVRRNLKFDGIEAYYESGKDEVWEKLRLMYSCRHFILSNSTFAWWAWYLSQNEQKTAVSPSVWFKGERYKDYRHSLIDDSWILVDI